jgi:hypothetical protein
LQAPSPCCEGRSEIARSSAGSQGRLRGRHPTHFEKPDIVELASAPSALTLEQRRIGGDDPRCRHGVQSARNWASWCGAIAGLCALIEDGYNAARSALIQGANERCFSKEFGDEAAQYPCAME